MYKVFIWCCFEYVDEGVHVTTILHDDVIKWTFSTLLAIGAGNSPVTMNFPHKGQWQGALVFSLICTWINGWVNNRGAGDLRPHRTHYDGVVMGVCCGVRIWLGVRPQVLSKSTGRSLTHLPLTKWPPFHRRYFFKFFFREWKVLYFD